MQAFVSGKNAPVVRRALQALIAPLQEFWGDPDTFKIEAGAVLAREAGDLLPNSADAQAAAARAYAQTNLLRANYMRTVSTVGELDTLYKALERNFATVPFALGCLWLAYRLRTAAINHLNTPEGHKDVAAVLAAIDAGKKTLSTALEELKEPTLDAVEMLLLRFAKETLGGAQAAFRAGAVAAHLIERTRRAARTPMQADLIPADMTDERAEIPMVSVLSEVVRQAELLEARQRFARLKNPERTKRYEVFRKVLVRLIVKVAKFAVDGFDKFCVAVENEMFPYPASIEWVRPFLKPVYSNAAQSSVFDACVTEQSVDSRYQKLREEKSVNIVMLELGRALARSKFKAAQQENIKNFLLELDMAKEFEWPASMDEFKRIVAEKQRAAAALRNA
ncbi:MAG: hypothetical protein HY342_10810 [Candidatus Lambdaproteobacteria bacterium]|nr:hypothetical protein [Candidatus Lambdaproteobacteria bacterium]